MMVEFNLSPINFEPLSSSPRQDEMFIAPLASNTRAPKESNVGDNGSAFLDVSLLTEQRTSEVIWCYKHVAPTERDYLTAIVAFHLNPTLPS